MYVDQFSKGRTAAYTGRYKKINQFEMLEKTFEELLITKEIAEEFGYDLPDWIKIVEISDK